MRHSSSKRLSRTLSVCAAFAMAASLAACSTPGGVGQQSSDSSSESSQSLGIQGDRTGKDSCLAGGELAEGLAASDRQAEALDIVGEESLVPGRTQTGVLDQDSCGDIVEVSAGRSHNRVGEQVVGTGLCGIDGDAPRGGCQQASEDLHERRLARAVGADQSSNSRFPEGEGDVEQSRHYLPSVGVGDGGQGDHELSLAVVSAL